MQKQNRNCITGNYRNIKKLDTKLENEEREEINAILRKNNKITWKHLQRRKYKTFTYSKFKPTRPVNETTEFERKSLIKTKRDNSGDKPPYASIPDKESNTDIHGKLNKQKMQKLTTTHDFPKSFKQIHKKMYLQ